MEDIGVDGRTILKCILKKAKGGCGMAVSCSGQEPVACSCNHRIPQHTEFLDSRLFCHKILNNYKFCGDA